jgi:Flp pilus assembly pilin Flp
LTTFPDKGNHGQHRGNYALVIPLPPEGFVSNFIRNLWSEDAGQDIAEYAVMVAVILIIVVGTIRLIGSNSNTVFSNVASSVQ